MGLNTVAVIYNDRLHEFETIPQQTGKRLATAVRDFGFGNGRGDGYFGAGKVVSVAHADYDQIVVVGQNGGRPISAANDLSRMALDDMAACLRRHGWKATPPPKRARRSTPTAPQASDE